MALRIALKWALPSAFTAARHMCSARYDFKWWRDVPWCHLFLHFAEPQLLSTFWVDAPVTGSIKFFLCFTVNCVKPACNNPLSWKSLTVSSLVLGKSRIVFLRSMVRHYFLSTQIANGINFTHGRKNRLHSQEDLECGGYKTQIPSFLFQLAYKSQPCFVIRNV